MELRNVSTVSRIALMSGEELKTFREKFGLSQEQLAKELKVARNTVSRWELKERKIPEFLELALQTIERRISGGEKDAAKSIMSEQRKTAGEVADIIRIEKRLVAEKVAAKLGVEDSQANKNLWFDSDGNSAEMSDNQSRKGRRAKKK